MQYANYFPASYQSPATVQPVMTFQQPQPVPQPQVQQQPQPQINWCQGEAAARAYLVAPNQSVMLMDSEQSVFYIKSADASGMPLPLRIFDYKERSTQNQQVDQPLAQPHEEYITRHELEERLEQLQQLIQAQSQSHPQSQQNQKKPYRKERSEQ